MSKTMKNWAYGSQTNIETSRFIGCLVGFNGLEHWLMGYALGCCRRSGSHPASGGVVAFKTGRWEMPGSNPLALVDLAVRSFPWFSPKLV